jgi:hypothetical protein
MHTIIVATIAADRLSITPPWYTYLAWPRYRRTVSTGRAAAICHHAATAQNFAICLVAARGTGAAAFLYSATLRTYIGCIGRKHVFLPA